MNVTSSPSPDPNPGSVSSSAGGEQQSVATPLRPREDGLAHPADTSRSNLAAALGLLSRWRLSTLNFRVGWRVYQHEREQLAVRSERVQARRHKRVERSGHEVRAVEPGTPERGSSASRREGESEWSCLAAAGGIPKHGRAGPWNTQLGVPSTPTDLQTASSPNKHSPGALRWQQEKTHVWSDATMVRRSSQPTPAAVTNTGELAEGRSAMTGPTVRAVPCTVPFSLNAVRSPCTHPARSVSANRTIKDKGFLLGLCPGEPHLTNWLARGDRDWPFNEAQRPHLCGVRVALSDTG
jgi:hypothetical protein